MIIGKLSSIFVSLIISFNKFLKMLFVNFLGIGGQEIIIILLIVVILFGGKKIPELMRGLGQGIKEFNNAKSNIESEVKQNIREIDNKN